MVTMGSWSVSFIVAIQDGGWGARVSPTTRFDRVRFQLAVATVFPIVPTGAV